MGNPEPKDNELEPKKEATSPRPPLEAIVPHEVPPAAAELIEDIDSYQERLEKDWENAKSAYQIKINRIMEEFLKENLASALSNPDRNSEEKNASQPEKESAVSLPSMPSNSKIENLIAKVEKELKKIDQKSKRLGPYPSRRDSFGLPSWDFQVSIPKKRGVLFSLAAVLVGALAILVVPYFTLAPQTLLPYPHTLGPVIANQRVYIVDWFRKCVYVHAQKRGLPIESVENLPNELATGIAMSDKALWSLDSLDKRILRHALTPDHQSTASIPTPGSKPVGLFFDGTDLWSADQDTKTLYRHRGNDLEDIRDEYAIPDMTVTAFLLRNNRLWILDEKARTIDVFRLQKSLKSVGTFDLDPFLKGATPTGLAITGKTVWVTTENPSSLIQFPLSRLEKSRAEQL